MTPQHSRRLRVLCTSTGGAGHVHALAPVALALRSRGHHVHWAVPEDGGGTVAAMGFEWSAAGMTTSARRDAAAADLAGIMQLPMAERRGPRIHHRAPFDVAPYEYGIAYAMVDGLVALANVDHVGRARRLRQAGALPGTAGRSLGWSAQELRKAVRLPRA